MKNYKAVIDNNHQAHFLECLALILQGELVAAKEAMNEALSTVEECTWRYLYVKGVLEINLGSPYEAAKEFSAGIVLEARA